jgi:peptidoglycan/LPS O-acetylase OafA/YrhL
LSLSAPPQSDSEIAPERPSDEQAKPPAKGGFYIPSLDGLRAVSITIVILSHAGLGKVVPGGFGVTIFFFLSGYLITTLLRREETASGKISLSKFYMRRVFRIFPPMYGALLLGIVATYLNLLPNQVNFFPTLFQALHLTNYYSFWGEGAMIKGTGILWSLAVEEHFYLVFPMICFILLKPLSLKSRALGLAVICALVLLWRYYLVVKMGVSTHRTYYGTDTRIDSILFGCIMGLFHNPVLDRKLNFSLWQSMFILALSGAMLVFSFAYRDPIFRETARYTLQGIALFPIFYLSITRSEDAIFRWLNLRPIRFIGVLSYSLYLVHHMCLLSIGYTFPELGKLPAALLGIVAAVFITLAFYYFLEQPSAKMRKKFQV